MKNALKTYSFWIWIFSLTATISVCVLMLTTNIFDGDFDEIYFIICYSLNITSFESWTRKQRIKKREDYKYDWNRTKSKRDS